MPIAYPTQAYHRLAAVLEEVFDERERQEDKCAEKRSEGLVWLTCADPAMPTADKLAVITEELGEVARELCDARAEKREPYPNLRVELVQLAACCVAWAESIDADEAVRLAA